MSGGAWDYICYKLEEIQEQAVREKEGMRLLAAVAKELEWGHSGDTCLDCARLRVMAALDIWFGSGCWDAGAAVALVRDNKQNLCAVCGARELKEKL
mgnify:FL=1